VEYITKLIVLISMAAALLVTAVINAHGWPAALPLTIGALIVAGVLGAWKAPVGAAIVLLFAYTFPAFVAIAPGQYGDAYTDIWMAALFGALLPRSVGAKGWSLPRLWKIPLALWALTVALVWPFVALRQVDFVPAVLELPYVGVSIRGLAPDVAILWVVNVALTLGLGILWFDWLFLVGRDSPESLERRIVPALAASWMIATAVALYQLFVDITFLNSGNFAFLRRASGTLRDANVFGVIAALCGPVIVVMCRSLPRRFRYPLIGAALAVSWIGVWASGSRTAFAASAIALAFMANAGRQLFARTMWPSRTVVVRVAVVSTAVIVIVVWVLFAGSSRLVVTSSSVAVGVLPAATPKPSLVTRGDVQQPLPRLTINSVSVPEGDSGTTSLPFVVTLAPASTETVTVKYATANGTARAGSDYVAAAGTLTFPAGVTRRTIRIVVNGDTTFEADETVLVNLSSPTNAILKGPQGVGTILNDDPAPISPVTVSPTIVRFGDVITVTVGNTPGNPGDWVGLFPTGAPDTGYIAWEFLDGSITVPSAGVTSATLQFQAPLIPGAYNVRLFANDGYRLLLTTSSTITVPVPAQPTLTIDSVRLAEGNAGTKAATFTVRLVPTATQTVTVNYATADGTATAGSDYVAASGTLMFAAGVGRRTIDITINGDTTVEPDETFVVKLSSPTNALLGVTQGVGTILNDDVAVPPAVVAAATTLALGDVITVVVSNGPGNPADWVGLYSTGSSDSAYLARKFLNGSNTPPATGLTGATLSFSAPDGPGTPGTYDVRLFAGNGSSTKVATSSTITVQNLPTLAIDSVSVPEGNRGTTAATFTVTLTPATTETVTVNYATADGTATAGSDYVASAGTLTFAPGERTRTIDVAVNGDTTPEPDETFVVNLSHPNNAVLKTPRGVGTILNDDGPLRPVVTVSPEPVDPGGTITATVENGPGNTGDWVGLYPEGAPDRGYLDWQFLNGSASLPAAPVTSATLRFTAPAAPGTYNVRFFASPFGGPMQRMRPSLPAASVGSVTTFLGELLWRRQDYGTVAVAMIRDHPIFGVGVGSFHLLTADYGKLIGYNGFLVPDNAQNWFRHQLAEFGILGSVGWIIWVVTFAVFLLRTPACAANRFAASTLEGALVGLAIISLVGMPTQHVAVTLTFWTLAYWYARLVGRPVETSRDTAGARNRFNWLVVLGLAVTCSLGTWYLARHELRIANLAMRVGWDYSYGLYDAEREPNGRVFRWTMQRAVAVIPAPKRWLKLTVLVNHADLAAKPVQAKVWRDGVLVLDRRLTQIAPVTEYLRVRDGDARVALDFWCSRVFRPSDVGLNDSRELGLQVNWDFVDGPPPDAITVAARSGSAQRPTSPSTGLLAVAYIFLGILPAR
jgi:hypothetical protein